jgi:hypothetical protein
MADIIDNEKDGMYANSIYPAGSGSAFVDSVQLKSSTNSAAEMGAI